ncbi:apolipoprotein N-acyltransferase [Hydrogenovibrio sp. 3SP14C1]|nr:apolipoprotein N-acyltransferase [Hydrogenovibrio sp. 3SP14C1]
MKRFFSFFKPSKRLLSAFGLGALMVFAHAPVGIPPLAVIALAGLFWLWFKAESKKETTQLGLWFGLGFFGVGVSWLISSMYIYADVNLGLAILATFIFILFLSLYFMLAGWLVGLLKSADKPGFSWLLVMPTVWVFAEWLRASLFGGFPFLMTGNSHLLTWLDGYALVLGVLGVSWAVAMTAGILLWLYEVRAWIGASFILASLWLTGAALKNVQWVEPTGKPVKVALLQGNVKQDQKWDRAQFIPTLKTYVGLTKQNLDADLIVWPETAVPAYYDTVEKGVLRSFIKDAQLLETDVLMGVITRNRQTGEYYNALVNARNPEQVYHKKHLVPFSEYFPFSKILKTLSLMFDIPFSEFSHGSLDQKPLALGEHLVGVSVCYEMAFGEELADSAKASSYLVTVSNDAWFAHTFEPAQQVQDVQMRAIELGREIARTTNTGYTVIVDTQGQIKQKIPPYETGVLRGEVQPYSGTTPYAEWKQIPFLLLLSVIMSFLAARKIMLLPLVQAKKTKS